MNAKKCDRCGSYYDNYKLDRKTKHYGAIQLQFLTGQGTWSRNDLDLCPACMKELDKFLRGKEDE